MTGQLDNHRFDRRSWSSQKFRATQSARIHPSKPYFVYAPCVDGEFQIDHEHPYFASYRFLITDSLANPGWLNDQWNAWSSTER